MKTETVFEGRYALAFEAIQKKLVVSEALKDRAGLAEAFNLMGLIHDMQGNYSLALEHQQKNLAL